MRIISGTARGRKIYTPGRSESVSPIRPTSDRVREALFSILGSRVVGAVTLDLFAGTGALGLEALSRGSKEVVFVDASHKSVQLISRNLELCGFSDRSTVIQRDLLKSPSFLLTVKPGAGFDIIFADPPYRGGISEKTIAAIGRLKLLNDNGLLIVEEASEVTLGDRINGLGQVDCRKYGATKVYFYCLGKDENLNE